MSSVTQKVIHLYQRDPQEALARLNRITGLAFAHWPESLVPDEAIEAPVADLPCTGTEPGATR
ncbi:hypothetical protein [Pseudomonas sp. RIT-PI-AD]|uniref:hypothetical protein n=1 Tax=Pseudomonas sp. RIT-PI-AD TaxID=3035294 RepID=UPI0021D9B22B|nr:hypothetical protein [Pseudomonas sp. RIT-PI-AD]